MDEANALKMIRNIFKYKKDEIDMNNKAFLNACRYDLEDIALLLLENKKNLDINIKDY